MYELRGPCEEFLDLIISWKKKTEIDVQHN